MRTEYNANMAFEHGLECLSQDDQHGAIEEFSKVIDASETVFFTEIGHRYPVDQMTPQDRWLPGQKKGAPKTVDV